MTCGTGLQARQSPYRSKWSTRNVSRRQRSESATSIKHVSVQRIVTKQLFELTESKQGPAPASPVENNALDACLVGDSRAGATRRSRGLKVF